MSATDPEIAETLAAVVREELRLRFDMTPAGRLQARRASIEAAAHKLYEGMARCDGCYSARSARWAVGYCEPHRDESERLAVARRACDEEARRLDVLARAPRRGAPSRLLRRRPR